MLICQTCKHGLIKEIPSNTSRALTITFDCNLLEARNRAFKLLSDFKSWQDFTCPYYIESTDR